jgi:Putative transposase
LPNEIAVIAFQNKMAVYDILFRSAAETLDTIAADPNHLGAEIGFLSVLHTWGQNLLHHPHLHCLVPGGGLSPDGERWIACKPGFFLPFRVLSRLFRRLFLQHLEKAFAADQLAFFSDLSPLRERSRFLGHPAPARTKEWVVYAKPPFAGPEQVLAYVVRYTHRIAISNSRLLSVDDDGVRFRWKDYRRDNRHGTVTHAKPVTADCIEAIRRILSEGPRRSLASLEGRQRLPGFLWGFPHADRGSIAFALFVQSVGNRRR